MFSAAAFEDAADRLGDADLGDSFPSTASVDCSRQCARFEGNVLSMQTAAVMQRCCLHRLTISAIARWIATARWILGKCWIGGNVAAVRRFQATHILRNLLPLKVKEPTSFDQATAVDHGHTTS
jgi:hypothetical protein